jgi:hypothetical protein
VGIPREKGKREKGKREKERLKEEGGRKKVL